MNRSWFTTLMILAILITTRAYGDWKKVETLPPGYEDNYWLEIWALPSDDNYIWISGFNGKILRSTDRGKTWAGTTIKNVDQLESIHFTSKKIGYTSGNKNGYFFMYKSTDGGASWFDVSPDPLHETPFWGNYFYDDNYGILVGGYCGVQYFFLTRNGGRNWNVQTYKQANTKMSDVVIYSPTGKAYAVSSGYIWSSDNGGASWNIFTKTGGNDWQEDIHIYGNTILIPFSGGCDGGDDNNSGIRTSTDFGKTWKQFKTTAAMYGSFLIDSLRGWACGLRDNLWYTSDGGDTWELRNCGIEPENVNLDDMLFLDDSTGWVVGEGIYERHFYDTLAPEIYTPGPMDFCGDADVKIYLKDAGKYTHIRWSDGSSGDSISVNKTGNYWVTVWDVKCNVARSDSLSFTVYPPPDVSILNNGPVYLCDGESAVLEAYSDSKNFQWSTGDTTQTIEVSKSGTYDVTVLDSNGCTNTAEIDVIVRPLPEPKISQIGDTVICKDDTFYLLADDGYTSYQWYSINNDTNLLSTNRRLSISESGEYYVRVVDQYGCEGVSDISAINIVHDSNRVEALLDVDKGYLYFDTVGLHELKCLPARIKNVTDQPFTITDAYVYRNIFFSIPQSQFPLTILPGETVDMDICYSPGELGPDRDTVLIGDVCSPHKIPLAAVGGPNMLYGTGRCNQPVMITSTQIAGRKYIRVNNPYPNPASTNVNLQYSMFVPAGADNTVITGLYSIFGEKAAVGSINMTGSRTEEKGTVESGSIYFGISGLPRGSYYIKVQYGPDIFTYPVTIL